MTQNKLFTRIEGFPLVMFLLTSAAFADVPRLIHYQGKLRTSAGAPVDDTVSLRFRLYDNSDGSGTALFDETHGSVTVTGGLFSVLIGSQTGGGVPDSAFAGDVVYLGVSVDGDSELAPRIRIASAPFAARTRAAEQLVRPGSTSAAARVGATGDVEVVNRLGVGTATPDPSASVDIATTSGGFLPPRLTTAQRNAIASPAPGLMVFTTDANCLDVYFLGGWRSVHCGCSSPPETPGAIDGPGGVCSGGESLNFSIDPVAEADSYVWSVTENATIDTGQGTTSVAVTSASTAFEVSVIATNGCGASAPSTLEVTVGAGGSGSQTFNASGSGRTGTIQSFTVPPCVTSLTIEAWGAQGGNGNAGAGGLGARMKGDVAVTPGDELKVLVGQRGLQGTYNGGGGGGTFVTDSSNNPLVVAGGGGGTSSSTLGSGGTMATSGLAGTGDSPPGSGGSDGSGGGPGQGGGGGGLTGDGANGTQFGQGGSSFVNGGAGGIGGQAGLTDGGFGCGGGSGASNNGGGGAGGYSGGGGGGDHGGGGGAGSYNAGTNQDNESGVRTGEGQVVITW